MKFVTAAGSVYEVDLDRLRIRRLAGVHPMTERQAADDEWKNYYSLMGVAVGEPVIIAWRIDMSCSQAVIRATMTSTVMCILP